MESLVAPSELPPKEDRNIAVVSHLAPLAGYFIVIGQILVPLGVYVFGPDRPFVKEQSKEALNAQISFTVYAAIVVFFYITIIGIPLAILLTILLGGFVLWTMIAAAIQVSGGKPYRYPLIFRLIR
ncbi:MAG: DUF4870 domain-containing protein [Thermaceae bacterium]|nr:DUF4870 domain-containing protein [Thermaceae bacterium]